MVGDIILVSCCFTRFIPPFVEIAFNVQICLDKCENRIDLTRQFIDVKDKSVRST